MLTKNQNKLLKLIPFILVIALSIRIISITPLSNDSYLHLGIGKFILDQKQIPSQDDLSYKAVDPSLSWLSHSYLSDAIFYMVTKVNFEAGIVLILSLTFITSLFFLYKVLSILNISTGVKFISVFFTAILAAPLWKLHPFIFLPILILTILFVYLDFKEKKSNLLWIIPIIFILFANLAGGFIFLGLIILLLILIIEIFYIKQSKNKEDFIKILSIVIISLFSSFLNPNLFKIWTYFQTAFSILTGPVKASGTLSAVLSTIDQSFVRSIPQTSSYTLYLVFLTLTFVLFVFWMVRDKNEALKKFFPLVLFSIFALLPFLWIKFTVVSLFITIPILAVIFDLTLVKFGKLRQIAIVTIVFSLSISAFFMLSSSSFMPKLPENEVKVVDKLNLPDNVFTTFDYTGYALYKLYPRSVYLDAQEDFFDENDLTDFYISNLGIDSKSFNKIAQDNDIGTVITSPTLGSFSQVLNSDPNWALVYFDRNGYVFVKKLSVSANFLAKNSIGFLDLSQNLGVNPNYLPQAQKELEDYLTRYPGNSVALGELATIFRIEKKFDQAQNKLNQINYEDRDFAFNTEMGRVLAAQGKCLDAQKYYLQAIKQKGEGNFSRAVLDIAVLYAGCLGDKSKAKHYFLRYNSYVLSNQDRDLLNSLTKQFGISLDDN